MALRSQAAWVQFFKDAGIPDTEAETYATKFMNNRVNETILSDITKTDLTELDITTLGDTKSILRHAKQLSSPSNPDSTTADHNNQALYVKPPAAKLPQLTADMTHPQYRKFKIDWDVFKRITNIPPNQLHAQLYSCCDESVQNSIINSVRDFFTLPENELLTLIESVVTKTSNPSVHRMSFSSITQSAEESIKEFVIRLKSAGVDCEFSCPSCHFDLLPSNAKDQFIRGIYNHSLQADILAKASHLKTLDDIVKHAESFESALRDQSKIQESSDVLAARTSTYQRQKRTHFSKAKPCNGCGSYKHGARFEDDREKNCPAWNTTCQKCNLPNHFANVCRKKFDSANALLAAVRLDKENNIFTTTQNNSAIEEIPALLTPHSGKHQHKSITMQIFPDSGASICLAGPQHLARLNIHPSKLIRCRKQVTAVGGSKLVCHGWLPVTFEISNNTTRQPLYICDKIDRLYFSRKGCTEVKILSPSFPFPTHISSDIASVSDTSSKQCHTHQPTPIPPCTTKERTPPPPRPETLPFTPTNENIPKLEKYIRTQFASSAFNQTGPFPTMSTPPAHIHLKPDAQPHARHTPIPVPYHWKSEVKASLDEDVTRGIIAPVPIGTPVTWCSSMVITPKKNGQPRRTVDLQNLNSQCSRETHHTASPFHLACQVPPHTKKTVLDAVDGYHAIQLDEASQPLTTFITEWGRYRYLRLPQGYLAAGDAYTRRYDEVIKHVKRKVKIVDDTLLHDINIEDAFYHTWDYLTLCAENGIVINENKFQFCQDTVSFAGLTITPTGVSPSDSMLSAIKDFPAPQDLTGARSWFGLVNQVAWAYSIGPIMQPFRELIKRNAKFEWTDALENIFKQSKALLVEKVEAGIQSFDTKRKTCLQTDWSRDGIGYLLLQKYCDCSMDTIPICCRDGWRLVFAGSRFTHDAETRYSPTEGEALAVRWSLENAKMFVLGCENLTVVTDHKPLLGIFTDRDLSSISNPRISNLKEKTLRFRFSIKHCPGKWHRGPDAMSRHPTAAAIDSQPDHQSTASIDIPPISETFLQGISHKPLPPDIDTSLEVEEHVHNTCAHIIDCLNLSPDTASINAINDPLITYSQLEAACRSDSSYQLLLDTITKGFANSRKNTNPEIREFWEVRHRLASHNGIALMDKRLVIPVAYRKQILRSLHSANQGETGMQARANHCVYWPGMNASIRNYKLCCPTCPTIAPSQSHEPLIPSAPPQWPFQEICMDYFEKEKHSYLVVVDRFSGWLIIHYFKHGQATSQTLISICREIFTNYGAPEEISSDGGPQLTSTEFTNFLTDWGIKHRISSVDYAQSNGRAELGVKTAKRIIHENTLPNGSLNNDKTARAILQYRNTPLPYINLSPAQILLHRQLRDHVPAHPQHYHVHKEWIISADQREKALTKRNVMIADKYNSTTRNLPELSIGAEVLIQNQSSKHTKRWNRTGCIVEVLPYRQYRVRVHGSGRITLRNRRFLKQVFTNKPSITPSATHPSETSESTHTPQVTVPI